MSTFDPNRLGTKIPSVPTSEAKIKADAKDALACLKRFGAIDLYRILGLTPYLEGEK
jgi:hypothetical protein